MNESERVMVGFEVSVVALPTPESSAARLVVRREHEQSVDLVQANAGHVFCTRERLRGENVQPR